MYAEDQEPKPVRLYAKRFYLVTLYDQKYGSGKAYNLETTTTILMPGDKAREERDHWPRYQSTDWPNRWAGAAPYAGPVYRVTSIAEWRIRRVDWVRADDEIEALRHENRQSREWTRGSLKRMAQTYTGLNYETLAARYAECVAYLDTTPAESDPGWRVEVEKVQ